MLSVISNSCSKDPRLLVTLAQRIPGSLVSQSKAGILGAGFGEPIKSEDPRSGIRGANQKRGSSERDSGSQSEIAYYNTR